MTLKRLGITTSEPVSVTELKDHLNIEHAEKDLLLGTYISAARGHIESSCHIAIAPTDYLLTLDAFPSSAIYLGVTPIIEVVELAYDDEDGFEQVVDPADYLVDASGAYGWVVPVADVAWPATLAGVNTVRVTFTAGYAETTDSPPESTAPEPLRQAIKLLAGEWFAYRGVSIDKVGNQIPQLPYAVEALISPFRQPVLK
jgi:uncharacterized phiE125 gp8 family phage protein